jgi:hypothetical protein
MLTVLIFHCAKNILQPKFLIIKKGGAPAMQRLPLVMKYP